MLLIIHQLYESKRVGSNIIITCCIISIMSLVGLFLLIFVPRKRDSMVIVVEDPECKCGIPEELDIDFRCSECWEDIRTYGKEDSK